jgi:hypothetical protein
LHGHAEAWSACAKFIVQKQGSNTFTQLRVKVVEVHSIAIEAAGIEFIAVKAGKGPGVRLRNMHAARANSQTETTEPN